MADHAQMRFRPLLLISRTRMILAWVFGPLLWAGALASVAWLVGRSNAIELGLAIAAASFVLGAIVVSLLRHDRIHEARRYARDH
jgi:hypothetical protein